MSYLTEFKDHIIIKRHFFLFFFSIVKFIFIMLLAALICYIAGVIIKEPTLFQIELYIIGIIILNYGFIKLILGIIKYHNNIIIICPGQIIIIKASLLLRDKIETLDTSKIMKLDSTSSGLLSNIFGYGNLIIEQQNDTLRTFHFISRPHKIISHIQKQKNKAINIKGEYDIVDYPLV